MPRRILGLLLVAAVGCGRSEVAPQIPEKNPQDIGNNANVVPPKSAPVAIPAVVYPTRELAKIFDASTLPTIDDTRFSELNAACLRASVPGTISEVLNFYLKAFESRGWKKVAVPDAKKADKDFESVHLEKDGHLANLVVSGEALSKKGPRTRVNIQFHGNFDSSTLPKPRNKPHDFASPPLSSYYSARTSGEEATFVTKTLVDAGWQEFSAFNNARIASNDNLALSFRKQGYLLNVFINALPHRDVATNVTYSVRVLAHELPAPPGAVKIEFDDGAWKMRCESPISMQSTGEFYQRAMPEIGYKPLPTEPPTPTTWNLGFGTDAGDIVLVQLANADGRTTKIELRGERVPPAEPKKSPETPLVTPPVFAKKPSEILTPPVPKKEILATKIPLPKDAKSLDLDAMREEITFRTSSKITALAEQFREQLTATGWQEQKAVTFVDATSGYLDFRQAQASLRIILVNSGFAGGTQVTIATKGLTWPKSGS